MATVEQIQDDAGERLDLAARHLKEEWKSISNAATHATSDIDRGIVPDTPHLQSLQNADAAYREALAVYRALQRLTVGN